MGTRGNRPTSNLDSTERESWSQKLGLRWVYRAHTSSELLMTTHMDRQKEGTRRLDVGGLLKLCLLTLAFIVPHEATDASTLVH